MKVKSNVYVTRNVRLIAFPLNILLFFFPLPYVGVKI